MTICFSLAQPPLVFPHPQAQALGLFHSGLKTKNDPSGDASHGTLWKAGREGIEPKLRPSLSSKGILFLVGEYWGLPGRYDRKATEGYKTFEGLLNGKRYAAVFQLQTSVWVPFLVQSISEFTAVKNNTGAPAISNQNASPAQGANSGTGSSGGIIYAAQGSGSGGDIIYSNQASIPPIAPPKPINIIYE